VNLGKLMFPLLVNLGKIMFRLLGKTTVSEYGWSRTRALQEISKKSSELRGKRTDSSSIED
jgi:hypothetical protein